MNSKRHELELVKRTYQSISNSEAIVCVIAAWLFISISRCEGKLISCWKKISRGKARIIIAAPTAIKALNILAENI